MVCIYCHSKTGIINSRHLARNNQTWRRRQCLKCKALMTTLEEANYSGLWMIINDKGMKSFNRDKLFLSIYDSLKHRKTAINDANSITSTIIAKMAKNCSDGRIEHQKLIEIAKSCLKNFDKPAFIHYQAFYCHK